MKIKHLAINPHDDALYPITWVSENIKTCKIDRNYKDDIEPVFGKVIFVRLPGGDSWAGYAANDEGWLCVCDSLGQAINDLPDISVEAGILEEEDSLNNWLDEKGF